MFRRLLARWMPRTRRPQRLPNPSRPRAGYRPHLDALEERTLLNGLSLLPSGAAQASLSAAYSQLPLSFEANQGQTDAQVNYLARGQGYSLFLTPSAAVLNLQPAGGSLGDVLRMQLDGANANATATGLNPLPGTSNYYVGNDPSQWHTNVPTFGRVEYQNVYNGINLDYYGNQQQLEYDFVVAPGADPNAITLDFQGADSISLNDQGNLILHTALGDLTQQAPVIYQNVNGVRQAVTGGFVLEGGNRVGYQVGAYDASQPLIIDPVALSYASYLGGGLNDAANGIGVDQSGDAFLVGTTNSINFPTTPGAFQPALGGSNNTNAFVTKFNPTGSGLLFSTYLGGAGNDQGNGVAVDQSGFAYVVGTTSSVNFPTTQGSLQPQFSGSTDTFVARFSPTGSLIYSTFLGGSAADQGLGIGVDNNSQAYVTGVTFSSNFPTTSGAFDTKYTGGSNGMAYASLVNSAGSQLVYSTFLGGSGGDQGDAIAVDANLGLAFVTGTTQSANFPVTSGAAQAKIGGNQDAFMAELNATGTSLLYATYIGGVTNDQGNGIAIVPNVDGQNMGNDYVYVAGSTDSSNFPTTRGAFQTKLGGSQNAFLTKIAPAAGGPFLFSTYLGGLKIDSANDVAVDQNGNAYLTGQTTSPNFPITSNPLQSAGGQQDAFLSELNSAGTMLLYSTYLGGPLNDSGLGIAVDGNGNAYLAGSTAGSFPVTGGSFQTTYGGGTTDGFVAKVSGLPTPSFHLAFTQQPTTTLFSAPITPAVAVAVENQTNQVVTSDNSDQITLAIGANPGGGTLGGTITLTVANGVATFNGISISQPGNGYTLIASAPNISGAVSNSFNIIKPTHLAFASGGQPTNTKQGTTIAPPVQVDILDANNNIVTADNSDMITIGIGTNPGGGTLSGTIIAQAVNGVATFSNLSINSPGNGYTLVATGSGLVSATSNTFNILASNPIPTRLAFNVQPSLTPVNVPITPAVTVQVLDVNGNVVTSDNTDQITLAIGANPGGATLGGTLTVTAVNGVATFNDVTLNAGGNGYTLTAAASNKALSSATSNPFNVFVPPPPVSLALVQQPTSNTAGATLSPPLEVEILDANGNVVTTDNTDQVTVSLSNNPSNANLNGTLTLTVSQGIATFTNLSINTLGMGYTLMANSGSLTPAVSNPFDISVGPVTQLAIQAPTLVNSGQPFTFTVSALDAFGNINANYAGTVTFSSLDSAAILPSAYTFVPGLDNGVHTFTAILVTPGQQTLFATGNMLPGEGGFAVISVKNTNIFNQLVTGTDQGGAPLVNVINPTNNAVIRSFFAYPPSFTGGVRVAQGDVEGIGVADIVTGTGPGGASLINVYNGVTGQLVRQFFAFDPSYTGGVFVTVGDVNGDGFGDIIVSADAGGGPTVEVFSGKDGSLLRAFSAYDPSFTGGVRVASGDVDGDFDADIITAPGPGGSPFVEVFSGATGALVNGFYAYSPAFTGGVYVATGAFGPNPLGGVSIVTGPGAGGGPTVNVFNGLTGALLQSFQAEPVSSFGFYPNIVTIGISGVRVGTINVGGTGAEIVTSFGSGQQSNVNVFDFASAAQVDTFFAYGQQFMGGVFVGVGSL